MSELKDYSILDIEAIDDDRFKKEKAPGKWVPESRVYLKSEVDKVIAELKQKLEDAKATAYAESVDAGMRERRLKRALYKACANWADAVAFEETEGIGYDNSVAERWRKMESKCRAKAEEYK